MFMKKSVVFFSVFSMSLLGLSSCSSRQNHENLKSAFLPGPKYDLKFPQSKNSERKPATTNAIGVPYVPGTRPNSQNNQPANPPSPNNPGQPNNPAQPNNLGHSNQPTTPVQPPNGAAPEARGGCPAPLNRIVVGGSKPGGYNQPYSVMDLLAAYNQQRWVTGSAAGDIALLRPWLQVDSAPGTDVFSALQNSKAWCRASEFVSGIFSTRCGEMKAPDSLVNPRMAAVLVAVLAVRNQPECIRQVRGLAEKDLGANVAEIDEAILPLLEASDDLREGKLLEKFDETVKNRNELESKIDKLDSQIAEKEKSNIETFNQSKRDLAASFSGLRKALAAIPPCAMTVKMDLFVIGSSEKADAASEKLVDNCKKIVDKKLEALKKDEIDLTAKVAQYAEKHATNPDLVETDEELKVKERLEKNANLVKLYQGYVDLLVTSSADDSVHSQQEKVDALMKVGSEAATALNSKSYAEEEIKSKKDFEARYRALSARYLTYGFYGGFGNLPTQ
jgi:hypothetical protein